MAPLRPFIICTFDVSSLLRCLVCEIIVVITFGRYLFIFDDLLARAGDVRRLCLPPKSSS